MSSEPLAFPSPRPESAFAPRLAIPPADCSPAGSSEEWLTLQGVESVSWLRYPYGVSDEIVFGKSAHEYFRDLVCEALGHRRLQIQEATEFYLVDLLSRFLESGALFVTRPDGTVELEPLALTLLRALQARRQARFERLRQLGDTSLFVSGFFGDSLARRSVDIDYYMSMGERAYEAIAGSGGPAGSGELFGELAGRFEELVDCFAEIAELSDLRSNRGLVRLYQRFLDTGSERVAERLRERGVALFAGPAPRAFKQ